MSALPAFFPRVPLKQMDPSMLVFELDRETARLMPQACELITSAATMASFLHRKQTRSVRGDMPRVPYIEHPLRVALRMVRWGVHDADLIAAALLHDVLEDCPEELLQVFGRDGEDALDCLTRLYGNRIAWLVEKVTNPTDGMSYQGHITLLAHLGREAVLIKASDLKDNAGSIRHQLGYGQDTKMLRRARKYLPAIDAIIASLMGMTESESVSPAAVGQALIELKDVRSRLLQVMSDLDTEQ